MGILFSFTFAATAADASTTHAEEASTTHAEDFDGRPHRAAERGQQDHNLGKGRLSPWVHPMR